jgi:hypothetical protein
MEAVAFLLVLQLILALEAFFENAGNDREQILSHYWHPKLRPFIPRHPFPLGVTLTFFIYLWLFSHQRGSQPMNHQLSVQPF